MNKSLYRHFLATYDAIIDEIETLEIKYDLFKNQNFSDIPDEIKSQNIENMGKLNKQINNLKHEYVFMNFKLDDIVYLCESFGISQEKYEILDKTVEDTINLLCMFYNKLATSEENKQIDKYNYTDNANAKRRFLLNYPHNPIEYVKAIKSKNPNRLLSKNQKNLELLTNLEHHFRDDKELLECYKNCQTLMTEMPTENDIKNDVDFLLSQKIGNLLKTNILNDLQKKVSKEVILRIKNYEKYCTYENSPLVNFIDKINRLEDRYIFDELSKNRKKNQTPEDIWNSIL